MELNGKTSQAMTKKTSIGGNGLASGLYKYLCLGKELRKDTAKAALPENRQRMPGEKCTLSHFLMSEPIAWLGEQTERTQVCDTAGDMAQPKNPGKNTSTFKSSIKSREKGIN